MNATQITGMVAACEAILLLLLFSMTVWFYVAGISCILEEIASIKRRKVERERKNSDAE